MTDYEVIIAGAGTGGATTAITLAQKGHSVLLIDRKERDKIGDKTCGDAIGGHHIKELKDMIGLPDLPKDVIEYEVAGLDLYAPDREHKISMVGPTTRGVSFNRLAMGQWFVELAEKAGAEVLASTRVKKLQFEDGKVSGVTIQTDTSDEKHLTSKIVIDATGATGMLRRQLPESSPVEKVVAKEDQMVAWRDVYETPEYEFDTPDMLEIYWNQEATLGGYTWVFPQGPHRVNVGLGVMTIPGYTHPKKIFENFVVPNWDFMKTDLKVIDSSGGIAPIRRPIDTMVDDNFMLVGDAACQVNPIHGGGIGSSMLGGVHAGEVAHEALETGDTSIDGLWAYNPRYMESYGIKQASLDVFRWFLLNVTNEEIDFAFEKGIVKGIDLLSVSMTGKMNIGKGEKFKRLLSGIGKIPLLLRVQKIANLMEEIKEVYSEYPDSPKGLDKWKARLEPIYKEAKNI
ncbi:MAG: geranylgeranyl reductase family protein [Candidatus Lokiarchaeota archaeon]|nr:geranylgeranyl reductase family protein [Candidatus Lokiarchaeota archaeon]